MDRQPVRAVVGDPAAAPAEPWVQQIPAVAQLLDEGLQLPAGVTLLVGENGTGKSTIVQALAMAFGLSPEGGTPFGRHSTRATESGLDRMIRLQRGPGAAGQSTRAGLPDHRRRGSDHQTSARQWTERGAGGQPGCTAHLRAQR